MTRVTDIGEDALVTRLLAQLPHAPDELRVGPGDDCAVVPFSENEWQLLKTDAIVEGVHFLPEESRNLVGWKAIARVVSDFAAMGGRPRWFMITVGIPADAAIAPLEQLYQGMADCLQTYGAALVGGETTSVASETGLFISIAATGFVEKSHLILRSTARREDQVFVTGRLGGSQAGRHLAIQPRLAEAHWLASRGFATAMMDLSDGLAKDLPRLARASGLGFSLDLDSVPCHENCTTAEALQDGEDYELLFTCAPCDAEKLLALWWDAFPETPLSCIGQMVDAADSMPLHGGWDHFAPGAEA
jgi:thiamine-monophosphate kinase